jgi:hypothetical protein
VDSAKAALAAAQQHAGTASADNQRVEALHNYTNVDEPAKLIVMGTVPAEDQQGAAS